MGAAAPQGRFSPLPVLRRRRHGLQWIPVFALLDATSCGTPASRTIEAHEPPLSGRATSGPVPAGPVRPEDQIRRLIERVEASGRVFVRGRRTYTAGEFADRMRETFSRHRDNVVNARELIERVGRPGPDGKPVRVRLPDGTLVDVRTYLHDMLDVLDASHPRPSGAAPAAPPPPGRAILDLLDAVARSGRTFLVPQRKGPPEKLDAQAFADLLHRKWSWLGADIEDRDRFIEQIASEPFGVFEPYLVVLDDGRTEPVASWLLRLATMQEPPGRPSDRRRLRAPDGSPPP